MARAALPVLVFCLVCATSAAAAQPESDSQRGADAAAILRRADAALHGDTTARAVRMTVVGGRFSASRVVAFHAWHDRRRQRSFIRILSPAKHSGTGFLRLPPNVWKYVPRIERITRVSPEQMSQPWMDSDFTLDDWLYGSSKLDDYDHFLLRTESDADGREGVTAYVVQSLPRAGEAATWGRIESWIETERDTPLRRDFHDRAGARVRTLRFHDVRELEGRHVPYRWVMTSAGEPSRETRIELESIAFDLEIDDAIFTSRNLKNAVER